MRERPILMSAPMVRATLDGTKTQTRRSVRGQPGPSCCIEEGMEGEPPFVYSQLVGQGAGHDVDELRSRCHCPYGAPGDRLWVREAFVHEPAEYCWEASVSIPCRPASTVYRADHGNEATGAGWKPSIHMPRALSRITLEITDVRVERLQAISETDAQAEGVKAKPFPGPWWQGYRRMDDGELIHQQYVGTEPPDWMVEPHPMRSMTHLDQTAVDGFRQLWASINGTESWAANPWVWVIAFKRIES